MASYLNPQPSNAILDDIANIRELENYNAQSDPSLGSDFPVGAKRFVNIGTVTAPNWQWQRYDGSGWVAMGATTSEKLMHNVDMLDGYHASLSAVKNTIPVYNANAQLVGDITGNAVTATKLQNARNIQLGGIVSSTAQSFNGTANITIPVNSMTINNDADDAVVGVLTPAHGGTGRTDGAAQDVRVDSLAGEVSAKDYGQIGQLPLQAAGTDLNSMVVDGRYLVYATDGEACHHPEQSNSFASLVVETCGNYCSQKYNNLAYGHSWSRFSNNKGASWYGWYSMGGARNDTYTIYISKSGSDSNTGLSSENPVLTIERAIRIAEGFSIGKSNAYVHFCIGEGNWGDVTFRTLPFWLQISPYNGTAPTEYSASLPVFGYIRIYASSIALAGVVADAVDSCYNATAYVSVGYKRIGLLQAYQYGTIILASSNSSTNVLEIHQQSIVPNYSMQVYAGGSIYAHYLTIRLVENITASAFLNISQGSFYAFLGRTLIDLNGFTFTGYKCRIESSGCCYSTESDGAYTFFTEVLPGSGTNIHTGAVLNGYTVGQAADNAVVHRTGNETIEGMKTFARSVLMENGVHKQWVADTFRPYMYQNANITKGTTPSATTFCYTAWYSSSGMTTADRIAMNEMAYRDDGAVWNSLVAFSPKAGSTAVAAVRAIYPATGAPYGLAPTTPAGSTGTEIVTADYLAGVNSNVVHRTGNEYVQGVKMFTNYIGMKNENVTLGGWEIESGSVDNRYFQYRDKNDNFISAIQFRLEPDANAIRFMVQKPGDTTTPISSRTILAAEVNSQGVGRAYAVAPVASSDTNDLATTAWVRDRFTISTAAPSGGTNGDFWFQY